MQTDQILQSKDIERLHELKKKKICCLQETHFKDIQTESKGTEL